jgi:hypothetical protein
MITWQEIRHHKLRWIALAGFSFVLLSALFLYCRQPDVTIDSFLGLWKTAAPQYQDRFFEITKKTITFGTGNSNLKIFVVDHVSKIVVGKNTVYTITYDDVEGSDLKLVFYYSPKNGGVIRFKNKQEIEWTRIKQNGKKTQS